MLKIGKIASSHRSIFHSPFYKAVFDGKAEAFDQTQSDLPLCSEFRIHTLYSFMQGAGSSIF